jgi:hypothetical protein
MTAIPAAAVAKPSMGNLLELQLSSSVPGEADKTLCAGW